MKAISAKPETVREVLSKKYIIPDFQRPYSWEKDDCDRLWQDLIEFFGSKKGKDDRYFLGNIVVNPTDDLVYEDYDFSVVDGQQRLTTLLLLIKVLSNHAGTLPALEECLRDKDPLTSKTTEKLRIFSCVLEDDKKHLESIILHGNESIPKCKILDNYLFFKDKMTEWRRTNDTTKNLEGLILTLLDNVVLLPILCDSEDDALTIFETINNRGLSLNDTDIFKAKLYKKIGKNGQDKFKKDWDELDDYNWLFRILMHVLRAESGDSSKEIGMRSYFTVKNKLVDKSVTQLDDPEKIMNSLKTIHAISKWESNKEISCFWNIMRNFPNYYWNFPLYVFLHKHGKCNDETGDFELPEEKVNLFTELLMATTKYFIIKGVVHNTVNAVRDTVFRVCVNIEKSDGDYLSLYSKSLEDDYGKFVQYLKEYPYQSGRFSRGLILLSAYLNPRQNKADFDTVISGKYDIEHVLPLAWNNYDGWTSDTHKMQLNTLGNLIPLERKQNISASNAFFDRKKVKYAESKIQDVIDLKELSKWTPEELDRQSKAKLHRLFGWFGLET